MQEKNGKRTSFFWRIFVLFIGLGFLFTLFDVIAVHGLKHRALGFPEYITAANILLGIDVIFILLMFLLPVKVSSDLLFVRIFTWPSGMMRILFVFLFGILTAIGSVIILDIAPINRIWFSRYPDTETIQQIREDAPCKVFWSSEGFFYPSGEENKDKLKHLFEKHGLDYVEK